MRKGQSANKDSQYRRRCQTLAGLLPVLLLPVEAVVAGDSTDLLSCPLFSEPLDRPTAIEDQLPGTVVLEADSVDITEQGTSILSGNVLIQRDAEFILGDTIEFDRDSGIIRSDLPVRFGDADIDINSDSVEYDSRKGTGLFNGVDFVIPQRPARGEAESLERINETESELDGVLYTTCPVDNEDWTLRASSLEIDQESGRGTGWNVRLAFMGVPFFYTPWLQFPIDDRRMTGLLFPEYGSSDRNGDWFTLPVYLNIAPNYDATIAPWVSNERGTRIDSQFRYLWAWGNGSLTSEYLDEDHVTGETRYKGRYRHLSSFAETWNAVFDYRFVSDPEYLQDFSQSARATEQSFIQSNFNLTSAGLDYGFSLSLRQYEQVDPTIAASSSPYEIWPSVEFDYMPLPLFGFLNAGVDTAIVNYRKPDSIQGWRQHVEPSLSIDFGDPGFQITPRIATAYTRFDLEEADGSERLIERTLPVTSLDARWILERETGSGGLQTLEPRVFYLSVPYRNQDDIPLFSTRGPTPSLDNLFNYNRFPGLDRYGDTEQVTLGLESNLFEVGETWSTLRLRAAQAFYFEDRLVTLRTTDAPETDSTSDLYTELQYAPQVNSTLKLSASWDDPEQQVNNASLQYQYKPGTATVLNVTYSFRRYLNTTSTASGSAFRQASISFATPISSHWKVFGKTVHSIEDERSLENLAGLEYESCCWSFRVVNRRYIFNRDGDFDQSLWLQLTLKGMGSVGRRADEQLARDIRGYGDDIDDRYETDDAEIY